MDDCEYRFLSLISLFSPFSLLFFSSLFPPSRRCSFARDEPGQLVTYRRGGRETGRCRAELGWVGFAEATGGQTDRRTERQTDRSSVNNNTVDMSSRQAAGEHHGGCLSVSRPQRSACSSSQFVSGPPGSGGLVPELAGLGAFRGGHRAAEPPLLCWRKKERK